MADSSPLDGLLRRAGIVFSLAGELGRDFEPAQRAGGSEAAERERHAAKVEELCSASMKLLGEAEYPPEEFVPVKRPLEEAARVARDVRDTMKRHDAFDRSSYLDCYPHLNTVCANGWEAIEEVANPAGEADPYSVLDNPTFSHLEDYLPTPAGNVEFLEFVRDEVHNAAEAKRVKGEGKYLPDTIASMVRGIRWHEASARLAKLEGLPPAVVQAVAQVLRWEISPRTIEEIDALFPPAVRDLRLAFEGHPASEAPATSHVDILAIPTVRRLLLHLLNLSDQQLGIEILELPPELRDEQAIALCAGEMWTDFLRRKHCYTGPEEKLHLEKGYELQNCPSIAKLGVVRSALSFDGPVELRLRVRLTAAGTHEALKIKAATMLTSSGAAAKSLAPPPTFSVTEGSTGTGIGDGDAELIDLKHKHALPDGLASQTYQFEHARTVVRPLVEARMQATEAESEENGASRSPKGKRSTERGEARLKLIAGLTKHHKYDDGGCLNLEPIGNNALARMVGVDQATASAFFKKQFKGHGKYKVVCADAAKLAAALKLLRGEFSPHLLYGARPAEEDERDEE